MVCTNLIAPALAEKRIQSSSYQILKEPVFDKIKMNGIYADTRSIVVGDFNNDNQIELLGFKFSKKYMDYVWDSDIRAAKKNDINYWKNGLKLSRDPSWYSSFSLYHLNGNGGKSMSWNVDLRVSHGCVHPSQVIPSYLNADNFLDFVIVCHGYDAKPFPGEHSLIMLSYGSDNYEVERLTNQVGFYHDGATADFNADGALDILLVDANAKKIRVYLNDGNGKFSLSNKFFSQFASWKAYTTEILDVNDDGHFDIFIAGHEDDKYGSQETIILLGNKSNKFSNDRKIVVPNVPGYGVVLDVIRQGDNLFVLRTSSKPHFYRGSMIQQVTLDGMKTVITLVNNEMMWLDRIFRQKTEGDKLIFGSLTNRNDSIDFTFDGKVIAIAD